MISSADEEIIALVLRYLSQLPFVMNFIKKMNKTRQMQIPHARIYIVMPQYVLDG
jgi:hypothetical protein